MTQTWFLDLDGIKSGPYQTHEVHRLMTEGSVMPHHRITENLKSNRWMSLLEWKLEQSKKIETESTQSSKPEVQEIILQNSRTDSPHQGPPTPPYIEIKSDVPPSITPTRMTVPHVSTAHPQSPSTPPSTVIKPLDQPTRDATSEMLALLQSTKHKRERQATQDVPTPLHTSTHTPLTTNSTTQNHSSSIRMVVLGILIALAGVALGQWLRPNSTAPVVTQDTSKPDTPKPDTPKEDSKAAENIPTKNETRTLKTALGKIMIQSKSKPVDPHDATPRGNLTHEESNEANDVRKELRELRRLKEELKNSRDEQNTGHTEEFPEEDTFEPDMMDDSGKYPQTENLAPPDSMLNPTLHPDANKKPNQPDSNIVY